MTVALIKTKAEQGLAADFAARGHDLPGSAATASLRAEAMSAFERQGLPHRRVEAWKYTDLRAAVKEFAPIATFDDAPVSQADVDRALNTLGVLAADRLVFVNGSYRSELSTAKPQVAVQSVGAAMLFVRLPNEAIVALNTALVTDGAMIDIADDVALARPLLIVHVAAGAKPKLASLRHTIRLGRSARATIIEAHVALGGAAAGQSNTVVDVSLGDAAELVHLLVGIEGPAATHLETVVARLGAATSLRSFQLSVGTGLARNQTFVTFDGEGAKLDISGVMLASGRQHIDTTLVIDHAVPACESRELFKAVLDDTARAVFQGKVIVRPDAQKTDGKQMAKALMLSEACEFDSKPELEIYADDVVCGHGATVAEIDAGMMFYLRSRGIPKDEARALLVESFVGEALEKIADETLRDALATIARAWLDGRRVS